MDENNCVCIVIKDLELSLSVGILPEEMSAKQRVFVSMKLYAGADYLQNVSADTLIDYGEICARLQEWEEGAHTDLVEELAEQALAIAFSYDAVIKAEVEIAKPDIVANAERVGVKICRER